MLSENGAPGATAERDHAPARHWDSGPAALWPLFDAFRTARGLVLAVSGGPDSTALMHLAAGWAADRSAAKPAVASVDHGLRSESAAEADAAVHAAQALGLQAERLVWTGEKPSLRVAERARAARYRLLHSFVQRIGASHLLTAHTLDDQAETVVMRLARGSGVAGVAAMRRESDRDGITLARPLLSVPKAELVALCRVNGWSFVEDPSNRSMASARVRWRRLAPVLAAEGLTAGRLARFADRAARADDTLRRVADQAFRDAALPSAEGVRRWRFACLAAQGDEITLRVLGNALAATGDPTSLRLERLEALGTALTAALAHGRPLRRTLGGWVVALDGAGVLSIAPEPRRNRGAAALPASSQRRPATQPFTTLTGRSLGNGTPASYIGRRDATARCADAVETHCTSRGEVQDVWLSTGRQ